MTPRRKTCLSLAAAMASALAFGACGSSSSSSSASASGGTASATQSASTSASKYKVCYEVYESGIHDNGFYELAYDALVQAQHTLGIKFTYIVATGPSDYQPIMTTFLHENCSLILEVGQVFAQITQQAAEQNPKQNFAIVDAEFTNSKGKVVVLPNVANLVFADDQATFLLGYLAAGMTHTGKIGVWGGENIPAVTYHEVGYQLGMDYYNKVHGTNVQLIGWNNATRTGTFLGNFTDQSGGYQVTQDQINAGADIIYSLGGEASLGMAAAAKAHPGVKILWTDTDACTAPSTEKTVCPVQLSTALKRVDVSVYDVVKSAVTSGFKGGIGYYDLANGGVALGPFHDFESSVPAKLQSELKSVQAGIASGKIPVSKLWS